MLNSIFFGRMGLLLIIFVVFIHTQFIRVVLSQTKEEHNLMQEVISRVDKNKDGKISKEEYYFYCKAEKFEVIDADNDGYIDSSELMKAVFAIHKQPPWNDWDIEVLARRYITKGRAYLLEGKLDEAMKEFNNGIEAYPEWGDMYTHLGSVYKEKGQIDKAIENFREAVRVGPVRFYPHAYLSLAYAHLDKNMYHEALQEFREVLKLEPENSYAIFGERICLEKILQTSSQK